MKLSNFKTTIISISLILICLLSFWLMTSHYHQDLTQSRKTKKQKSPDAFMVNAQYTTYNSNGHIHAFITAPSAKHYPGDNSTLLKQPHIRMNTSSLKPWFVTANFGKSIHGNQRIYLWGDVRIHQPKTKNTVDTVITTSSMTVFPNTETAITKQPVTILRPGSKTQAVGLKANFKTGVYELLSDAKGQYAPNSQ